MSGIVKKIQLGIYCPHWLIARHNTDHKVTLAMNELCDYAKVSTNFIASPLYTLSFNANHIMQKFFSYTPNLVKHGVSKKERKQDIIYHYGKPLCETNFYQLFRETPVITTIGFMTDRHTFYSHGGNVDRKKQAAQLAKKIKKASLVHFHTENGRKRFLEYQPSFERRTVSIPFFLPHLAKISYQSASLDKSKILILFVGYQGKLKGLDLFIDALDSFSSGFLDKRNVEVCVVSKDKPKPKTNFSLKWYSKLPNKKILNLMEQADIFSFVSKRDSYGLVLIEAMANGCAIVADDDETRKEIVRDAGICIPPDNASLLKNTLEKLIESKELRIKFSSKGKKRFYDFFSPAVVAESYEKAFRIVS